MAVLAVAASMPAASFTVLSYFNGTNGAGPESVIQGLDGNLYGTMAWGGANGYGTVFKATPAGVVTTLYNFCALANCKDGENPNPGLLLATDGVFYGTSLNGGAHQGGTIFKLTADGILTILYGFCGPTNCPDGAFPNGALLEGIDHYGYGTTFEGGAYGSGTVFKIWNHEARRTRQLRHDLQDDSHGNADRPAQTLVDRRRRA